MNKKFSKGEAIKFGWEGMKKNFWLFAGVLVLLLILSSISSSGNANAKTLSLWGAVISLLVAAIDTIIQMGIIRATLKVVGGEKPKIDDIFAERKLFWRYLGATILYGLIVVGGLILFIIPGIIWSLKYQFARYFIIDKKMGIMESFKRSGEITMGQKGQLFLFCLLMLGITILGALAFGIGLFAAMPTVMIAGAFVYRKLSAAS